MKTQILSIITAIILIGGCSPAVAQNKSTLSGDRGVWVNAMVKIADPVLSALAVDSLKIKMHYESKDASRQHVSYLEAVGRLICGISPWLELGPDDTPEGQLRAKYIDLALQGLKHATDPRSKDFLEFKEPYQPLVDAAFLAEGLLRAPKQLWGRMDAESRANMIAALKSSRAIKPWENNWLLFASTIEAALLEFTGDCDSQRLTFGVFKFRDEWYKGDALYGDGPKFHQDYYNSFVIHPMLTDVLVIMQKHHIDGSDFLATQQKRLSRYAAQLERFISPEGTFPVVGRSIVYRTGCFHALAQASLMHQLSAEVQPAQVRCGMTAMIRNFFAGNQNFDADGWLRVGFNGLQLDISESYINTGSAYLCASGFLALGLPATDEFWSAPAAAWSSLKAWQGDPNIKADHALE